MDAVVCRSLWLLPIFLIFISAHIYSAEADWTWTYSGEGGPEEWPKLGFKICNGTRQSPINIVTSRTVLKSFGLFEFLNFDQIPREMTLTNNEHTAEAKMIWDRMPMVRGGGLASEYEVFNFHFHWGRKNFKGSEHTINGESFPLEMHVVCKNVKYENISLALEESDGLAVFGVMFEISRSNNRAMASLEPGLKAIVTGGSMTTLKNPPRLLELMPWNTAEFYRYDGSLTTPSCNEAVTWSIFLETVKVTKKQMMLFRALNQHSPVPIGINYRPLQQRFGRDVYLSKPQTSREDASKSASDDVLVTGSTQLISLIMLLRLAAVMFCC